MNYVENHVLFWRACYVHDIVSECLVFTIIPVHELSRVKKTKKKEWTKMW